MTLADDGARGHMLRRGFILEHATLAWNVPGIVVLNVAAISAQSVALAAFGLDSLIEIGASTAVIWELSGTGLSRQRQALRLIRYAFAALTVYLLAQSTLVLAAGYHPRHSPLGITWTAVTAAAMFARCAPEEYRTLPPTDAFDKLPQGRDLPQRPLRSATPVVRIGGLCRSVGLATERLGVARRRRRLACEGTAARWTWIAAARAVSAAVSGPVGPWRPRPGNPGRAVHPGSVWCTITQARRT